MRHEIKPSLWDSVYYEDWEINQVIVSKNWRIIWIGDMESFYQEVHWNIFTIECWEASMCYRIIRAEKQWEVLQIEVWDSTLKHRR